MAYSKKIINHTRITLTSKKTGIPITILETDDTKDDYTVGDVVAGIPITESTDESLDTLTFTVMNSATKKLFSPFDVITFIVDDGSSAPYTREMCVLSDHAQTLSPEYKTYKHFITCIEETKILEKTKIFNLNLTNEYDTLLRQFEKAINNAELLIKVVDADGVTRVERKCRYSITDSLKVLLQDKPGEDFWFSNTDLRTVLDGILAPCNARIEVKGIEFENSNIKTILLGYRLLSEVKEITPDWTEDEQGKIVGEELENNGHDYAGKIVARGYNTNMPYPIKITDTLKSASSALSDKTATIFLPFPISDKGVVSLSKINYHALGTTGKCDINTLPMEQWELLSEADRKNYIPYCIGSDRIPVGQYNSDVLGFTTLNFGDGDTTNCVYTITYYPRINTALEITKQGVYDKDKILMEITDNQSEGTLDLQRHRQRLESLIKRTGNDEYYIDVLGKYFSKLLPLMSKIKMPSEIQMPSDKTDYTAGDYIIYKRECGVYDKFIKCRYFLSKDFNAIQKVAGVNRQKHLYDIPLESDECPINVNKYILFGFEEKDGEYGFSSKFIGNLFGGTLLRHVYCDMTAETYNPQFSWKPGWYDIQRYSIWQRYAPVTYAIFKTWCGDEKFPHTLTSAGMKYDKDPVYVRPVVGYGGGNTINFMFSVVDNYSVDYSTDGYSIFSGKRVHYNSYISSNEKTAGECDKFQVWLVYDYGITDNPNRDLDIINKYPQIEFSEYQFAIASEVSPLEICYIKDRSQKPVFKISFECIPTSAAYGKIFIGNAFCRDNQILRDDNHGEGSKIILDTLSLAISFTDKFVGQTEILPCGYTILPNALDDYANLSKYFKFKEGNNGAAGLEYIIDSVPNGDNVASWAFVNEKNEVYLAVNGKLRSVFVHIADYPD